jgi:hypothetical protein
MLCNRFGTLCPRRSPLATAPLASHSRSAFSSCRDSPGRRGRQTCHGTSARYLRRPIKFSYMRSDRFLDLRRSLHALKLDFGRSFHFSYLAMITGTYVGMIGCIDDYSRELRAVEWGSVVSLHGSNSEPLMSALGQKRTLPSAVVTSALPPKDGVIGRRACG